jgi:hypothetical protein
MGERSTSPRWTPREPARHRETSLGPLRHYWPPHDGVRVEK